MLASRITTVWLPAGRLFGIAPNGPLFTEYTNGAVPHVKFVAVNEPLATPLHVALTAVIVPATSATLTVTGTVVTLLHAPRESPA